MDKPNHNSAGQQNWTRFSRARQGEVHGWTESQKCTSWIYVFKILNSNFEIRNALYFCLSSHHSTSPILRYFFTLILTGRAYSSTILTSQFGFFNSVNMRGSKAPAEIRKRQIIVAAMRCFQKKGYVNTTVDDIAAEYGLSKGSIYWYYSSKKAVLIDIFKYWKDETLKGINAEIAPLKSPREKLVRMGEFYIESLIRDLELYSSMMVFWGTAFEDMTLRDMIIDLYSRYDEIITSLLYQGEGSGEFEVSDKKTLSTIMISMMEGLIVRQVMSKSLDLRRIRQEVKNVVNRLLPKA